MQITDELADYCIDNKCTIVQAMQQIIDQKFDRIEKDLDKLYDDVMYDIVNEQLKSI